jgi:hypothetical protein
MPPIEFPTTAQRSMAREPPVPSTRISFLPECRRSLPGSAGFLALAVVRAQSP